jgi:hypothetical protein
MTPQSFAVMAFHESVPRHLLAAEVNVVTPVIGGLPSRHGQAPLCQWVCLRRNGSSWALPVRSAFKAMEFDGIGNGIKQVGHTESGVNTEDGECY